jgi:DNA-binding MarR family transcriptional regulator
MSIFDPIYRQKHVSGQIGRTLFNIGQAIKHILWEKGKLEHLTPAQIQALLFLKYIRPDAATVNTLSKYLSCKPATVSGILDALQSKKLVSRNRDTDDRRKVLLSLTPKGLRAVHVVENLGQEVEEMISELGEEELEVLVKLLSKMSKKLLEKGYIMITDVCTTCCFFKPYKYPESQRPHYCEFLNIWLGDSDICKECPDHREALN